MMLAAGCSIAHGQGLVEENYNIFNVTTSYPNQIAKKIGVDCNNISYPGYSNEMIFHSAISALSVKKYSYCLISWTSNSREGWSNDDELFTFNLNYARYDNKQKSATDIFQERENNVVYTTNDLTKINLDRLKIIYPVVELKILTQDEHQKLKNYQIAIEAFCELNNIHLVQIDAVKNNKDSKNYLLEPKLFQNPAGIDRHPPQLSHDFWANDIYKRFYE